MNKIIIIFLVVCAGIGWASWNSLQEKNQILYTETTTDGVIIYPTFTDVAYSKVGFYQFLLKKCDTCKTAPLDATNDYNPFGIGEEGYKALKRYYPVVTDIQVDQNPDILKKYQKVIVLHNEFVTQKEFDAITNQSKVVYLYPDSLHNKVTVDYNSKTVTMVQANGFPNSTINNAFGWAFDNYPQSHNLCEKGWHFVPIPHAVQLDCYPEVIMPKASDLIDQLRAL